MQTAAEMSPVNCTDVRTTVQLAENLDHSVENKIIRPQTTAKPRTFTADLSFNEAENMRIKSYK